MCVMSPDTLQAVGHNDFTFTHFLFALAQQHLMLFACYPIKKVNGVFTQLMIPTPLTPFSVSVALSPQKQLSWVFFF